MVKYVFLLMSFFALNINLLAQTSDSLIYEKKINSFEKFLSENLVIMWEKYPVLTKCSWKYKFIIENELQKLGYKEFITLSMIIDTTGKPIYVKVNSKMKPEDKNYLIKEVKKLKFEPAEQNGKQVDSYTLLHFPQFKETSIKDKKKIDKMFEFKGLDCPLCP